MKAAVIATATTIAADNATNIAPTTKKASVIRLPAISVRRRNRSCALKGLFETRPRTPKMVKRALIRSGPPFLLSLYRHRVARFTA
jgi:hypothetical protein